jgi:MoaA/NifB/PqqE/SkfB family radical SAM enzyme
MVWCKRGKWYLLLFYKIIVIDLFSFFKKEFLSPYRLIFKITNACNFKCTTCGNWQAKDQIFLSQKKQLEIFEKQKKNVLMLTITGGEPFYNTKYLIDTIVLAKEKLPNLYYVSINTNGYFSEEIHLSVNWLLSKYNFLKIFIGLSYIPNKEWGNRRNNIEDSFDKYEKTLGDLEDMKKIHKNRLSYYLMFTVNNIDDARYIKKEKDFWFTFAEINDFYNNAVFEKIGKMPKEQKEEIIKSFLKNNRKIGYVTRRFYKNYLNILSQGKRNFMCYAGINRMYYNERGDRFICTRGVKKRKDYPGSICKQCWTQCEGVFDVIQRLR